MHVFVLVCSSAPYYRFFLFLLVCTLYFCVLPEWRINIFILFTGVKCFELQVFYAFLCLSVFSFFLLCTFS